jgi:hypothetical protein
MIFKVALHVQQQLPSRNPFPLQEFHVLVNNDANILDIFDLYSQ